jgi:hypothetical protein
LQGHLDDLHHGRLVAGVSRGETRIDPEQLGAGDAGRDTNRHRHPHKSKPVHRVQFLRLDVDERLLVVAGGFDDLGDRFATDVFGTGAGTSTPVCTTARNPRWLATDTQPVLSAPAAWEAGSMVARTASISLAFELGNIVFLLVWQAP